MGIRERRTKADQGQNHLRQVFAPLLAFVMCSRGFAGVFHVAILYVFRDVAQQYQLDNLRPSG
mgnify:CR=1 FL=1